MFGLGQQNEKGEQIIEICERKKIMTAPTWLKYPMRRRYTWTQSRDHARYQIDCILVGTRYENSILDARVIPGDHVDSVAMKGSSMV